MFREAGVGEAEEDEAEDGRGILRGLEAGVGAELIGGGPEAFFEGVVGGVFFRGAIQTMWECFLWRQRDAVEVGMGETAGHRGEAGYVVFHVALKYS